MKLTLLYRRRWWLMYLPVLLGAAVLLWWAFSSWQVLAPTHVVIAAGSPQGSYARLAQRYADQLERDGVNVDIVYADSQREALDRLLAPAQTLPSGDNGADAPARKNEYASVGFAQGMYARSDVPLQALAVVGREPVWVFSGPGGAASLAQAHGMRVAAGPVLSSSHWAARALLRQAGLGPADVRMETTGGLAAANALLDGKVDMVIDAAGEDSQAVQLLLRSSGVRLLGIDHAGALATQYPSLQPMLLPQGAIELRGDVPSSDLTMMSLQTNLVVRPEVHPALQRALMDAAVRIHELPGFLQRHGQFPGFRGSDFALSPTARNYSLGERPWLESLLPYGKAQWAELFLYALLPILLAAFLLLAWIPRMFNWRVNSALHNFYGELKFLDAEIDRTASDNPMGLRRLLEQLDQIEQQVVRLDLPAEFSERWYTLREHLAGARERLLNLRAR